ncbi:hypothetical protein BC835DRAFT_158406 [Cytidiella melzeri]|nr:hypothetical protein BC835DRAFT_158406 [Cytidiella melzeri]
MSGFKRRSTVHDLSSLRLHPDGSKVINSDTNLHSRKAKYAAKDARGNWIAQDAGGLGRVKTRLAAAKEKSQAGEEGEEGDDAQTEAGPSYYAADKGKQKAVETREELVDEEYIPKNTRAKKRRAFADDFTFIASSGGGTSTTQAPVISATAVGNGSVPSATDVRLPQPSSDLLKCIHYFASALYTEMGQLRDSSREYRREKKRRRLARLAKTPSTSPQRGVSDAEASAEGSYSSPSSSSDDEKEEQRHEEHKRKRTSKSGSKTRSLGRKGVSRPELNTMKTDMYKACDGSALMAIGMLLQQHVADILSPETPDGWEEAMIEHGELPLATDPKSRYARSKERGAADDEDKADSSSKSVDETGDDDSADEELEEEVYVPD